MDCLTGKIPGAQTGQASHRLPDGFPRNYGRGTSGLEINMRKAILQNRTVTADDLPVDGLSSCQYVCCGDRIVWQVSSSRSPSLECVPWPQPLGQAWKTATGPGDPEEGKPHIFLKTEGIPVPLTEWQTLRKLCQHPRLPHPVFSSLSPCFLLSCPPSFFPFS